MALETLLIAAQTGFNLVGGLFETGVGLVGSPFGVERHARTQPQRAVRAIA